MRTRNSVQLLIACCVSLTWFSSTGLAEETDTSQKRVASWPQKVLITVGEIRTRIDGPKMWTLSGIDYRNEMIATEESAYGTVLTIRNAGPLGTAHFLDAPSKPGRIEKEEVTHLRLLVDGKAIMNISPEMNLQGDSFRMERKSQIRTLNLESTVLLEDGVLSETAHFVVTEPLDLKCAYPWMYAWTPKATHYVIGDETGIQRRGTFLKEGKAVSEVIPHATWMAVYNPSNNQGSVCYFLKSPVDSERALLLVDAPGAYRKTAAYTLVDQIVPKGFTGTYQSAVGFFTATMSDWEKQALRRATELRSTEHKPLPGRVGELPGTEKPSP